MLELWVMDLILIYFLSLLLLSSVYFNFGLLFFSLFLDLDKECDVMSHVMVTQVTKYNRSIIPVIE